MTPPENTVIRQVGKPTLYERACRKFLPFAAG
jgi:hypothetical protein